MEDKEEPFDEDVGFKSLLSMYRGRPLAISRKLCFSILLSGLLLWIFLLVFYSQVSVHTAVSSLRWHTDLHLNGYNVSLNPYKAGNKNLTMELYRQDWAVSYRVPIQWLTPSQYPESSKGQGMYLTRDTKGGFIIRDINSNKARVLFELPKFAYKNTFFNINRVILNPGNPYDERHDNYHIVVSDIQEQWRSLSFGLYWKYDLSSGDFSPIQPSSTKIKPDELEKLHFVEFSPDGKMAIFGYNHNLYVHELGSEKTHQLTTTGSTDIFHGKPDWVYEEEVLDSDRMVWWSPDSQKLIFASLNDTLVNAFKLNYYVKPESEISAAFGREDPEYQQGDTDLRQENKRNSNDKSLPHQYVTQRLIKYPKPGTPNPVFSVSIVDIKTMKSNPVALIDESDDIMYRGAWIDNDSFLLLTTDRSSEVLSTTVITAAMSVIPVLALNASLSYGGWIEKMTAPCILPKSRYIDKVVYDSRVHLAIFSSPEDPSPTQLTRSKSWEVTRDSPIVFNTDDNRVYFLATVRSSMDAHLMAVDIDTKEVFSVTDTNKDGAYEAHFSEGGKFVSLILLGPGPSWQRLLSVAALGVEGIGKSFDFGDHSPINLYEKTQKELAVTNLPTRNFRAVRLGVVDLIDVSLNVMEIFPPNFDPKKKHPLIVHAYGGPGSQQVQKGDQFGFLDVLSATLDAVVLVIDPRGTQGHGWDFKAFARHNIGYYEPRDILTVASEYISVNKAFIDKTRTAMWGWSYGGFVTLKVLEVDAGKTIRYGMAVAPVTNWMFYDSVYTERYLGAPQAGGYANTTSVHNFESFKSCGRFLMMHGTADDNVHFLNLAWLVDKLNVHGVENYDLQYFPDNDHSIHYHNGDTVVYDKLMRWLENAFEGVYDHMH